ncbi:MAG: metallophosphoesterase [Chlamydiia bacterium]|nr:metallophosphoesterase [Chlamydiia bacterium]
MKVWAIADLHLAVSTPGKEMDFFGGAWVDYTRKIEENWRAVVAPEDLVLIPGDISWAMKLDKAIIDLEWIDKLPGTKLLSKGNHDLWWSSINRVREVLPPSIHVLHNDAFNWHGWTIGGARLWDTPEYNYADYVNFKENPHAKVEPGDSAQVEKIFSRELDRLEMSLKKLSPDADRRVAMIHYPPIGADLKPSRTSAILEKYDIDTCVFGHVHEVTPGAVPLGEARGVTYHMVSADYLKFKPLLLG